MLALERERESGGRAERLAAMVAHELRNPLASALTNMQVVARMTAEEDPVSGTARLKVYKGSVMVQGRRSDQSLYDPAAATFEADDVYDQGDAGAFIRLQALRLRNIARRQR